jgi:hypothetical protein
MRGAAANVKHSRQEQIDRVGILIDFVQKSRSTDIPVFEAFLSFFKITNFSSEASTSNLGSVSIDGLGEVLVAAESKKKEGSVSLFVQLDKTYPIEFENFCRATADVGNMKLSPSKTKSIKNYGFSVSIESGPTHSHFLFDFKPNGNSVLSALLIE